MKIPSFFIILLKDSFNFQSLLINMEEYRSVDIPLYEIETNANITETIIIIGIKKGSFVKKFDELKSKLRFFKSNPKK